MKSIRYLKFVLPILAMAPLAILYSASAEAQSDYPNKAVLLIIPTAGTASEGDVRAFTQIIEAKNPGANFVVEQRAGAAGAIGAAYVARAKPDGYTLLVPNTTLTISAAVSSDLPYDVLRDFSPVTLLTQKALLFLANSNTPIKTMKEYLDYAKANPGKLNFGTSGSGSGTHLPGALLHYLTKTQVTFVHYKKASERLTDLMAGRTDVAAGTYATVLPLIKAGKVRPLAVTTSRRIVGAPDVPTVAESGVPGFDYSVWAGLIGPAKLPQAVADKLHKMWADSMKEPSVVKRLEADGTLLVGNSPAEFQKFIAQDFARWKSLVAETGIKIQED